MSDIYKLQYNGMTLAYPGWNGYISFEDTAIPRNVILNQQTGGTITADVMSGYDGDIITLSNTADAGYTFNTYNLTGATLTGNQFEFSGSDVTAEPDYTHNVYSVTLTQVAGGKIAASPTTGYYGTQVTLSNTPSAEYTFGSYSITGATLTSNKFNFGTSNVTAKGSFTQKTYTLTLQTDGHGKLVANKTTGHKNDTITLTPSYSSYYRFNKYSVTGGTVNGNTFTITANATAKANFKVNAFTASGGWEKGSNVSPTNPSNNTKDTYANVRKYAITSYHTSNVPASWYSTSSRWSPSNASAYSITLKPIMKVQGTKDQKYTHGGNSVGFSLLIGSTYTNGQTNSPLNPTASTAATAATATYSKTVTTSTQTTYSISARLHENYYNGYHGYATYLGNQTTGTWVATGYIP